MRLLFRCLSLALTFIAPAQALHVVIDPGHGGLDSGAVRGSVKESDISLRVSQALKELLQAQPDFQVSLTREIDQSLGLPERVSFADKQKADLFVSIHANASSDQRARGVEFYFQNHLPPDEETLFMAAAENKMAQNMATSEAQKLESESEPTKKNDVLAIVEDLKRQHRMKSSHRLGKDLMKFWKQSAKVDGNALRQAPFYVVSKTSMPSVLVELGFISNPKEAERLSNPEMQKQIASRLAQGILHYKEIVDKVNGVP